MGQIVALNRLLKQPQLEGVDSFASPKLPSAYRALSQPRLPQGQGSRETYKISASPLARYPHQTATAKAALAHRVS